MTETNGWPGKPGVPLNPEQSGWHIVQEGDLEPERAFWRAYKFREHDLGWWKTKGGEDFIQPYETSNWRYFGPALSHDQATALQARVAELEKENEIMAGLIDAIANAFNGAGQAIFAEIAKARAVLEGKKDEA